MPEAERLRCNICDTTVDMIGAKDHAATTTHVSKKSRLEEELKSTSSKKYADDSSVMLRWAASI